MREFPEYDVDCEYNRDGFDVTRLKLSERPTTDDNVEAVALAFVEASNKRIAAMEKKAA